MHGTTGKTGMTVAYEVHGANQRFVNNKIKNAFRGMWVAGNLTSASENIVISANNIGPVRQYGIDFYRETVNEGAVRKVLIDGNTFEIDDTLPDTPIKSAIQIAASYSILDVRVQNNTATKTGNTYAATFFQTNPQSIAANTHDRINVSKNSAFNFSIGAAIGTNATNGYGGFSVDDNEFTNLIGAGPLASAVGVSGVNINASGAVATLRITNNKIQGSTVIPYGIFLQGTITDYLQGINYCKNVTTKYTESATITNRQGIFDKVSYTPTWSAGAAITLGNGSVSGIYSMNDNLITADIQLTVGSTTSFGAGGTLSATLPFAAALSGKQWMGQWRIQHAGAFTTGVSEVDGTASVVTMNVSGATNANNTSPIALANGDIISIQISYSR